MSTEQIIKKSKIKKSKIKLIIEEDFDISKLKNLPELLVNYCFSFLSTPETPEQRLRFGCPDSDLYTNGELNTEKMKEYQDACDRFFTQTEEKKAAWWNRPAVWWKKMVKTETERMWNEKYVPVITSRFKKMPNSKLKRLTEDLHLLNFGQDKSETKKSWIEYAVKYTPTKEWNRKFCLIVIMLSKGMKPTDLKEKFRDF